MGKIKWTEKASSHLQAIHDYIAWEDIKAELPGTCPWLKNNADTLESEI